MEPGKSRLTCSRVSFSLFSARYFHMEETFQLSASVYATPRRLFTVVILGKCTTDALSRNGTRSHRGVSTFYGKHYQRDVFPTETGRVAVSPQAYVRTENWFSAKHRVVFSMKKKINKFAEQHFFEGRCLAKSLAITSFGWQNAALLSHSCNILREIYVSSIRNSSKKVLVLNVRRVYGVA